MHGIREQTWYSWGKFGLEDLDENSTLLSYTTNAIESINMSLRKVIKTRSSFPTDEAVTKLFYLALNNISKKWSMPIRDWKAALNRFTIQFEERLVPA